MSLLQRIRRRLDEHQEDALVRRAEQDLDALSPLELRKLRRILEVREAQGRVDLVKLQTQDAMYSVRSQHRDALIEQYLEQIEALNLKTPGGLRSIKAEEGEDAELVAAAWRIFCERRRGGSGRLG